MKIIKCFVTTLVCSLCLCGFSTTAYAGGSDQYNNENTGNDLVQSVPLTPDGNLTLVDDIQGDEANSKQFVTVQSKAGNYFYLIIDRDGERENVYFLNLVDEADLLALIEELPVEEAPTPPPVVEETPPVVEEPTTEKEKSNSSAILGIFLILGLAGGGAYYYFKVLKPKQDNTGATNLDEYDFDDEDEELILDELSEDELYNEETEA